MESKVCNTCGESKSLDMFAIHTGNKKPRKQCRSCVGLVRKEMPSYKDKKTKAARLSEWRTERGGKDIKRDISYQYKFGINLEEYNDIRDKQESSCAICGTHQDDLKIYLAVDHCHESGEVRGLLCTNCNNGLGRFKDNIEFLKKAIDYLQGESHR